MWEHRYNRLTHSSDWVIGACLDHENNVWITGRGNTDIGKKSDWVTLRYSSDGDTTLSSIFDGEGGGRDYAYDVAVGPDGKFYVAGYVAQTPDDIPDMDFAVVAFKVAVPGDVDGSGGVDIDDIVYLIAYVFQGGPEPQPLQSGDVNCSGGTDIDDIVYLIAYVFQGGYAPCDPDGNGTPDC